MYSKNDYRYYLEHQLFTSGGYLEHYGVAGMHWGIRRYQPYSTVPRKSGEGGKELGLAKIHNRHKAERYSRDTNQRKRNEAVRASKVKQQKGDISKKQHKENVRKANAQQKERNAKARAQLKKSKSTKNALRKYKKEAYETIPNYNAKRVGRVGAKAFLAYRGLAGAASIPVLMAAGVAPELAIPAGALNVAAESLLPYAVGKKVHRKVLM